MSTEPLPLDGCICKGNWRAIVKDHEHLIGRTYLCKWGGEDRGKEFTFFGIVYGVDDYYYGMCSPGGSMRLLSCVGAIEGFGFELQPGGTSVLEQMQAGRI